MDSTRFDGIAKHLIKGYMETAVYSRQFADEHGSPPSLMAKIHNMRSCVQALLTGDQLFGEDAAEGGGS